MLKSCQTLTKQVVKVTSVDRLCSSLFSLFCFNPQDLHHTLKKIYLQPNVFQEHQDGSECNYTIVSHLEKPLYGGDTACLSP